MEPIEELRIEVEQAMERVSAIYSLLLDLHQRVADAEAASPPVRHRRLTDSELRVLEMMAQGYSLHQIASRLGVARSSIAKHAEGIYKKLGTRNMLEASLYAWRHGIVSIDEAWETVMTLQWRNSPKDANKNGHHDARP